MDFPKRYDAKEAEPRIRKLWEDLKIHKFDPNSEKPIFSVDTPPPYVSAAHLHVGHAMSYSQAEFVVRYKRMRGFNVFYPMGFDDNGLPTERYVENKYKVDKHKVTRDEFIKLCLKETKIGSQTYRELWEALGISVDWDLTYSTIDERSQRTAQRSFLDLHQKGLIIRKDEPILWCYRCGTSLAQADVETEERPSKITEISFHDQHGNPLVIATTRPELIPACVALYMNPEDERYRHLIGKKAIVPLFDYEVPIKTSEAVDISFGTGLMMVCTWGDADDVAKWKEDGLETRSIFDLRGRLNELAGPFAGMQPEKARDAILAALSEKGLTGKQEQLTHLVGVHERCGTVVEFNHSPQWFIKILGYKQNYLKRGQELEWFPPFMKVRYETWVDGLKWDWCISRQRYYGVPFPIWYCENCEKPLLAEPDELPVDPTIRPPSPGKRCECGSEKFRPEADVMDTWMTSSLTPLINSRWAFDDPLHGKIYPMDIRVQAFEIIRTWLFYTVAKSHHHTNSLPWRHVMISGWGLDKHGKKMSKRAGNFVDPMDVISKYGADALRYWSAGATLGNDLRYSEEDVSDGRRLITKLWNATRFVSSYLFDAEGRPLPLESGKKTTVDRWILSRFAATAREATEFLEQYEYSHALKTTERFFFAEFCDNYLEIVKERFWNPDKFAPEIVEAGRHTLFMVNLGVLKMFAPFLPFVAEDLYRIVFKSFEDAVSIHVSRWPEYKEEDISPSDEEKARLLIGVLSAVRKRKTELAVHQNHPLSLLAISAAESNRLLLEPVLEDLRAASRAECISFEHGGDVETEIPGVSIKVIAKEKTI